DGFDAKWVSVRASDVGAPHRRERIFILVADPESVGRSQGEFPRGKETESPVTGSSIPPLPGNRTIANTECIRVVRGGAAPRETQGPQSSASGFRPVVWGEYEPAITRWEHLTRPAPLPVEPNRNGNPRLTVAFSEWVMGLPEGWVDNVDIPYGAKLKLLGNGVVPQQASLALSLLLPEEEFDKR